MVDLCNFCIFARFIRNTIITMKKLFTLLFVFAAVAVSAQSFSVTYSGQNISNNDTIDVATLTSQAMNNYIEYANLTSEGLFFKVRKEEISVADDAQVTFCVGGACYAGNLSQELFLDENQAVTLADEEMVLHTTFYTATPGTNLVKYTFFNTQNENDAISFVIRYTTTVTGIANVTANSQLRAYPNPVVSSCTIEYDAAGIGNAKVTVRNLTGAIVYQQAVQGKGKVHVSGTSLKSGVYFYSLESNGKAIVSKKLLVK